MRDVARDLVHGQHVHVGGLAAVLAMQAGDLRAAVQATLRLEGRGDDFLARLEHAPVALHAAAEARERLGPDPRGAVFKVMVERCRALDPVLDAPALAFSRRRFRGLDAGAEEAGAGQHVADVAGQPRVIFRDDVRVELALDFVYDVG